MEHDRTYLRKRRIYSSLSLLLVLLLLAAAAWLLGDALLGFFRDPQAFRDWARDRPVTAVLAVFGFMLAQVLVMFLPCEMVEIASGYAFGPWGGLAVCLLGLSVGSLLAFLLVRKYGGKLLEVFITREQVAKLKFIRTSKRLNTLAFLLFFIPGVPKDPVSYFLGMTPMTPGTFLLLSSVARIPSVLVSTLGGHALGEKSYLWASVVFGVTALMAVFGAIAYKRLQGRKQED